METQREARDHAGGERLEWRLVGSVVVRPDPNRLGDEDAGEGEHRPKPSNQERRADCDEKGCIGPTWAPESGPLVVGQHLCQADDDQRRGRGDIEQPAAQDSGHAHKLAAVPVGDLLLEDEP